MNSKLFVIFALMVNACDAMAEDTLHLYNTKKAQITLGSFMNTKYAYGGLRIQYYTPKFLYNQRLGLNFQYKGYRMTRYILSEYNKINFTGSYLLTTGGNNNYQYTLLPKTGITAIWNLTNVFKQHSGLGIAFIAGLDYVGRYKKITWVVDNDITVYRDGFGLETELELLFPITRFINIGIGSMVNWSVAQGKIIASLNDEINREA